MLETLIDVGKTTIEGGHGFHIQSMLSDANKLVILLLQDYCGKISQYRLDFGEILYYEFIDEHISAPRFLDKKVFEGIIFSVLDSTLLSELRLKNDNNNYYHYYICSDLYHIDIVSTETVQIEKININSDTGYIL